MANKFIVWFSSVDREDIGIVGGKGANLGEMTKAGFPVPNGFIVTAQAYFHFLDVSGLRDKIKDSLTGLDVNSSAKLDEAAKQVQRLIVDAKFPKDISDPIIHAYYKLDRGIFRHALVAVRSSATAEDLPGASFAGQQSTFLNVHGESNVIEKVKEAWASLFTARAIFYRQTNKFDHFQVGIAIPVQRMVESEKSGIMFTIDPVTNDKGKVMIEAIYGLGEMIVQGAVTPDHYEVNKKTGEITVKSVHAQEKTMYKKGPKNVIVQLPKEKGSRQKLTDEEIQKVAELGKKLEKHYYFPQDVEWAIEDGRVYIVQTRPVTTVGKEAKGISHLSGKKELLVKGDPASPGISSGPVQILKSAKEINKISTGEILVASQTNPDFVPAMKKAVAIVTERGGRTSHAAIVSRELGIPAVVGAPKAMTLLKDGMIITVNGSTGEVWKGALVANKPNHEGDGLVDKPKVTRKTATKVYVNLAEVSRAQAVSKMGADGIGLLRAEFMIADIGIHPKKLIHEHKEQIFIRELSEKIATFCRAFEPRPVVYRATDFKTNEYRNLTGGKAYEPEEPNPMLGFRGAARYVADPKVFEMEIAAVKHVRNKLGHKNLHLMVPFVRNPKELSDVKKILAGEGLTRSASFHLWLMVEIPTNVIRLEDFLDVGVDGVSIGSNDLTMLMLGTDRDNSDVAHDFSELDPTLLWAFEHVAKVCGKRGVTTSMCGQAPSDYPDLVHKLVGWGFTSMSVNPDALDSVRETVFEAEQALGKSKKG